MINPFLRCGEPAVVTAALERGAASARSTDVFAALRRRKNQFQ
jgi:hydroxyacylglutathione hydrolase